MDFVKPCIALADILHLGPDTLPIVPSVRMGDFRVVTHVEEEVKL